jgi:hypothetical protein
MKHRINSYAPNEWGSSGLVIFSIIGGGAATMFALMLFLCSFGDPTMGGHLPYLIATLICAVFPLSVPALVLTHEKRRYSNSQWSLLMSVEQLQPETRANLGLTNEAIQSLSTRDARDARYEVDQIVSVEEANRRKIASLDPKRTQLFENIKNELESARESQKALRNL